MIHVPRFLVVVAALVFLASSIAFAALGMRETSTHMPAVDQPTLSNPLPDWARNLRGIQPIPAAPFGNRLPVMAQPEDPAIWVLLVGVWLAVAAQSVRILTQGRESSLGADDAALPDATAPDATMATGRPASETTEQFAFAGALVAAAIWPWLCAPSPSAGLIGAALAAALAIIAALGGLGHGRGSGRGHNRAGVFAGWAVVTLYACFAQYAAINLGVSPALAAIVAVLLLLVTAVEVQLRIGGPVGFSLAIICALIGIAARSMEIDVTVTVAAIIAIAVVAAVMVRVLS